MEEILDRISKIEDGPTRDRLIKKYQNEGIGHKDFIGIDNDFAMALSLMVTKVLIAGNFAAGNEVRARELMDEHNAFCKRNGRHEL